MKAGRRSASRASRAQTRRVRDAAATRAALLSAGEKLFAERGFDGTTLDDLAAASRVNKALVSYYFGSKAGLYDAIISSLVSEVLAAVADGERPASNPAAALNNYIVTLARALAARPSFPAILLREYLGGSVQTREGPTRDVLQFYQMTKRRYDAGRAAGLFKKTDPHVLHLAIVGTLVHYIVAKPYRTHILGSAVRGVSNPSVDVFARQHARLILEGLRRVD